MARKERKYHYIYKITCLKNNRYYIGMHSTDNLEDGYFGGGKRIKNSVKKHGKDAHRKEILEFFENRELLRQREIEMVNEELLNDPTCMNLQLGGGGGFINDKHLKKFQKAGVESARIKLKELRKNSEWNNNYSKKISESIKLAYLDGRMKPIKSFYGRSHSDESKEKISKSLVGKQKGNKNSQFGTIWITNDIVNKKIKSSDSIPNGWRRGRI